MVVVVVVVAAAVVVVTLVTAIRMWLRVERHALFDLFFGLVVVTNSILIGADAQSPHGPNPTFTYQNLLFCRVPINPILGFVIRTYKKEGFGRLR